MMTENHKLKNSNGAISLGLISDTHMPLRWPTLPTAVFDIFADVDLILHAGDVGELWVLDELSQIAPVTAVHGNDETAEATRELPYQQIVSVNGRRLVLWHSHYPDPAEEMVSRTPEISPDRNLSQAKRAGADVVVFGHWHIPFTYEQDGILVINPGAIASGNATLRQTVQTVAKLVVFADGRIAVTHYDLANPTQPIYPKVDWSADFTANAYRYNQTILAPELANIWSQFTTNTTLRAAYEPIFTFWHQLAHRCWSGEWDVITAVTLLDALEKDVTIPLSAKKELQKILAQ